MIFGLCSDRVSGSARRTSDLVMGMRWTLLFSLFVGGFRLFAFK
jgi:hypothetical protein